MKAAADRELRAVGGRLSQQGRLRHADEQAPRRSGYGSFPIDDDDGRRAIVQRIDLRIEPRHEASVRVSGREHLRYRLNILFGGVYAHSRVAFCRASERPVVRISTPADWPPDYVVFRQEPNPSEARPRARGRRAGERERGGRSLLVSPRLGMRERREDPAPAAGRLSTKATHRAGDELGGRGFASRCPARPARTCAAPVAGPGRR